MPMGDFRPHLEHVPQERNYSILSREDLLALLAWMVDQQGGAVVIDGFEMQRIVLDREYELAIYSVPDPAQYRLVSRKRD